MAIVPKTRWTTAELLCVWLLCWIPAGAMVWAMSVNSKSRDPLEWFTYVMMTAVSALVFAGLVAGIHPDRLGWFDGGKAVLPPLDVGRSS